MTKRVESPSSINTFKQCRRKYYYQYIEKLPVQPNIHQVWGNIAHSALENFFTINTAQLNEENFARKCRESIQTFLLYHWKQSQGKLRQLQLNQDQERFYFEETMLMLMNWVNHFVEDLSALMKKKNISAEEAFVTLTPLREQEFASEKHSVRGFIDAIRQIDDEIQIIDYKTNSTFELKESIKLQLAIYSLLYFEKHQKMPSKVGIFFLRHKLKLMPVDEKLLALAKKEIEEIHQHTGCTEKIEDYPKTINSLCKWSTGKCDFYDVCQPHEKITNSL